MDISEYEAMKENKALLEKSLETERGLKDEIVKLKDEKLKALEDAKMKVVKQTNTTIHEYVYVTKPTADICRDFLSIMGFDYRTIMSISDDKYKEMHVSHFIDATFNKTQSISHPTKETIVVGLDEVKREIKEDLEKSMNETTANKIKKADEVISKNESLIKTNSDLKDDNASLNTKVNKLTGEIETIIKEADESKTKVEETEGDSKILSTIKQELQKTIGFFNRGETIDRLRRIVLSKN